LDFLGFLWPKWAFSMGYGGKNKKISPRLETRPGCKSGVRRGVCGLGLRSCGGRFIIAQIIDEISYLRKILSMDSVILLGPALVSARMSERTTSTAYGPLKKRRASGHVFALFALGCSLPANLDKAHKGGGVTVVAHQHRCGRSAPILKPRRIPAAHSWYAKAQVDQSSHSQEIFYVYIAQQAYHDEEVNPTPTHEGRTVVHQEMFSVHSQQ
jgi:hypothetical protein